MASYEQLIKRLPQHARELVKQSRHCETQDRAASDGHWNGNLKLQEELLEARSIKAKHERDLRQTGSFDSKEWAVEAEAAIQDKLAEIHNFQADRPQPKAFINKEALHKWLEKNRATTWTPLIPNLKLAKSQTAGSYLLKVRDDVDAERLKLKRIETAPLPDDEAIARAISNIGKIAAAGAPDLRGLSRLAASPDGQARQGDINWPQAHTSDGQWYNDGFSLLVWLHSEALIAKITAAIKAGTRPGALSSSERSASIAASHARLLHLERLEEAAFRAASVENPTLRRRPVDFQALLQIEPAPKTKGSDLDFG